MEIYIDIFFLENMVMNYLILVLTAKLSKNRASGIRLFLGAVIGASYAVLLLTCPDLKIYYTALAKFALSMLIVAVSFSLRKFTSFIKTLAVFYVSTFIFAGSAFAFLYFNESGGFVKNGIVYVFGKSRLTLLFLSIMTVAIIMRIFWDVIQHRLTKERLLIPLKISFENKCIGNISALVDTGNSLHDPLSKLPVIVVEFNAIEKILPNEIKTIFEEAKEDDLNSILKVIYNSSWISRFRLIPFTSLGKENGMLIGFKPDYVEVGEEDKTKGISNVIVGVYNKALSRSENYNALLSPDLV